MLDVFLDHSPLHFFRQSPSLNLELTKGLGWVARVGWGVFCLHLPAATLTFSSGSWIEPGPLSLHSKQFTHSSPQLSASGLLVEQRKGSDSTPLEMADISFISEKGKKKNLLRTDRLHFLGNFQCMLSLFQKLRIRRDFPRRTGLADVALLITSLK